MGNQQKFSIIIALFCVLFLGWYVVQADVIFLPMIEQQDPTFTRTMLSTSTYYYKTATPTPTGTATPTPSAPIEVQYNYSYFLDNIGYLHILGEVANHTSNILANVVVNVTFLDANNQYLASTVTTTLLSIVPANDKTCFSVLLQPPAGWATFKFTDLGYSGGQPLPNIEIMNSSTGLGGSWYQIIGVVRNDTSISFNNVKVVGTLYDDEGKVMGCDSANTIKNSLEPAQTSAFELFFTGQADYYHARSYHLQAEVFP